MLKKILSIAVVLVIIVLVSIVFINFYNKSKLESNNFKNTNSEPISEDSSSVKKDEDTTIKKDKDSFNELDKNEDSNTEELINGDDKINEDSVGSDGSDSFSNDKSNYTNDELQVESTGSFKNDYIGLIGNLIIVFGIGVILLNNKS